MRSSTTPCSPSKHQALIHVAYFMGVNIFQYGGWRKLARAQGRSALIFGRFNDQNNRILRAELCGGFIVFILIPTVLLKVRKCLNIGVRSTRYVRLHFVCYYCYIPF